MQGVHADVTLVYKLLTKTNLKRKLKDKNTA